MGEGRSGEKSQRGQSCPRPEWKLSCPKTCPQDFLNSSGWPTRWSRKRTCNLTERNCKFFLVSLLTEQQRRTGSKNRCAHSRVVANVLPSNAVSKRYMFGWKYLRNSSRGIRQMDWKIVRSSYLTINKMENKYYSISILYQGAFPQLRNSLWTRSFIFLPFE